MVEGQQVSVGVVHDREHGPCDRNGGKGDGEEAGEVHLVVGRWYSSKRFRAVEYGRVPRAVCLEGWCGCDVLGPAKSRCRACNERR